MINSKMWADLFSNLKEEPELWRDDSLVKLYIYCIANASHNQYQWRGELLHPGDLPLSERKTAEALSWSRDKVRRKIRVLAELGIIRAESTPCIGTMLHIIGWPQNDANKNEWVQNSAIGSGEASRIEPQWPRNEASCEENEEQRWSQNETSSIGTCFKTIPHWPKNHTNSGQTGLAVRPNPYK